MQNTYMNKMLQRIADAVERWTGESITIDVTGAGDMHGATSTSAGAHGLVPAPAAGDEDKVLSGAGTWIDAGGGELGDLKDVTITSPTSGESLKYDGTKWVNGNVTAELPDFIKETSGSIVTVNAAERPAKSLEVAINPVQSGSGDPSPENVRPISGWTGCEVIDDAVYGGFIDWNQLIKNGDFADGTTGWRIYTASKGTLSVSNKIATITYSTTGTGGYAFGLHNLSYRPIPINHKVIAMANVKVNFTCDIQFEVNTGMTGHVTPALNTWTKAIVIGKVLGEGSICMVKPTNANIVAGSTMSIQNFTLIDLTLMFGSTIADEIYAMERVEAGSGVAYFKSLFYKDYYAYNSGEITNVSAVNGDTDKYTTYPITFPSEAGTVYGGTLDVVNGVLTVTKANVASYDGETLPGAWISDRDVYSEGTTPTTGAQVVYDLDTPITYQLTPTEVQMLLGTNNIWADTGEITELKYINQTYNDLLKEVGVTYKNRASVDTGEIWIDGNPIKVFTLYYNGLSGSSNRILLSDFGFTDTINSIVDIKTLYKNNVNGETHSQGAYCYSWYSGGWINTYINMDGTIYIRFYYT